MNEPAMLSPQGTRPRQAQPWVCKAKAKVASCKAKATGCKASAKNFGLKTEARHHQLEQ